MSRVHSVQHRAAVTVLVAAAALAAWTPQASARDDYDNKDFSVRFAAAFIRFTEVSAAGGETVANRWSSSINPAAAGWTRQPGKLGLTVAPYYSNLCLSQGTRIHVISESLTWSSPAWGTFQPVLSQIRSNRAHTNAGLIFDYKVDTVQALWGKRIENVGFGASFSFSQAKVKQDLGTTRVSDSESENYRWRAGALWEPVERWLLGLAFEYGFSNSRSDVLDLTVWPPVLSRQVSTLHQFVLRPGVSYEYMERSTVFADYQFGTFFDEGDCLKSHWFSAGIEHNLLKFLFLRATAAFDARGNVTWGGGASAQFAEWIGVEFGYKHDAYPELRREFGMGHVLQLVLSVRI